MADIQPGAWPALDAYFRDNAYFVTQHHLSSFDEFMERGIPDAIRSMNPIKMLKTEAQDAGAPSVTYEAHVYVGSKSVTIDKPTIVDADGSVRPLFPNEARLRDMTYAVNVYADVYIEYFKDGASLGVIEMERPALIGSVPLMLHSKACLLHGMPADVLREMGECQYDQGGYFIVSGSEKVIISEEVHVDNRLYVRQGDPSKPDISHIAYMRCFSTDKTDVFPRTTTFRVRAKDAPSRPRTINVVVTHIGDKTEVPLFVLFRALGVESDKAIIEHIVYDTDAPEEADIIEFLRASALDAAAKRVLDQRAALRYLAPLTRYGTDVNVKDILTKDLFPNVPPAFKPKALLLGHVVRKIVRSVLGKEPMSERDDYSNVRIKLSGFMMSELFRDAYLRVYENCRRAMDAEFYAGAWRIRGDIRGLVNVTNMKTVIPSWIISDTMIRSMRFKWGIDDEASAEDMKEGRVQDLNRVSYLTYVSHVRRVNNPIDRTIKIADPHKMRASQWGCVCPVESPDGPNIGLIKHLAVLCHVTRGSDAAPLREHLVKVGLCRDLVEFVNAHGTRVLRASTKVSFNDTWTAVTFEPQNLVEHVRRLRRAGYIERDTSITWNILRAEVHVFTDRGRCCRPLARVEDRSSLLSSLDDISKKKESWDALFCCRSTQKKKDRIDMPAPGGVPAGEAAGPLELIDVEESMSLLVAMSPAYIERYPLNKYTHCEIHPATILSVVTGTYPILNHNNAAYNVLCLAQFKQAIGVYCTNFAARMDVMGCVLNQPQRPLVSTRFADQLCQGNLAHGENIMVAISSYTGYNQEDSILLNYDSVMRGRLGMTYFKTHVFRESAAAGGTVAFGNPVRMAAEGKDVRGLKFGKYDKLTPEGFPTKDAVIDEDDVVLGRVEVIFEDLLSKKKPPPNQNKNQNQNQADAISFEDRSVLSGRAHSGVVDRVFAFKDAQGQRCCKLRMRQWREPELGDKMGSRFGQKGVIGMLLRAKDMPFCHESGLVPDLILNPNAFPKRMTVTHLLECLLAKAGAVSGRRFNATTFESTGVLEEASGTLEALGLHAHGDEILYNGKTGEQVPAQVFVGVNYYGRFKHMVKDKYQYRHRGPVSALVRQPAKTSGGSGGLRVGEMERDVIIAHGLTSFLKESFMDRSDRFPMYVDAEESIPASIVNPRSGLYQDHAKPGDRGARPALVQPVEVPYAFKTLQQELHAMSLDMRTEVQDPDLEDSVPDVIPEDYDHDDMTTGVESESNASEFESDSSSEFLRYESDADSDS